ncbi:MAG: hypothetical protein UZ09_BCD002002471 [Bacteroidetes bacterium OLB9]|nr:MAG: hypothetical protein UZ09_BCD002002471 [Bacteroidetes bacterium OLB9]
MGQAIKTLSGIHIKVDIIDLPAEMYIFDIRDKTINVRQQLYKNRIHLSFAV